MARVGPVTGQFPFKRLAYQGIRFQKTQTCVKFLLDGGGKVSDKIPKFSGNDDSVLDHRFLPNTSSSVYPLPPRRK